MIVDHWQSAKQVAVGCGANPVQKQQQRPCFGDMSDIIVRRYEAEEELEPTRFLPGQSGLGVRNALRDELGVGRYVSFQLRNPDGYLITDNDVNLGGGVYILRFTRESARGSPGYGVAGASESSAALHSYDIHILGPRQKKHSWQTHTVARDSVHTEISKAFAECISSDYQLLWKDIDVSDKLENTAEEWKTHPTLSKVELKLKLTAKGFSTFTLPEALQYIGLPSEYDIEDDDGFTEADLDKVALPVGTNFAQLLDHFSQDLVWRMAALGSLHSDATEQTHREIISPVFVLAVTLVEDTRLVAERPVHGSLGSGPLDWAVLWKKYLILLSEIKKKYEEAIGQAIAQTAAAREELVRKTVGCKRRRSEIDEVLPVPSTHIVTTGTEYRIFRYYPRTAGEGHGRLVQSKWYSVNLSGEVSLDVVKRQVKTLVGVIVQSLLFQKAELLSWESGTKRSKTL